MFVEIIMTSQSSDNFSTSPVTSSQSSQMITLASTTSFSPVNLMNNRLTSTRMSDGISLLQEKEELAHLNDRLAAYIDRVRYLEEENGRLMTRVQTNEERIINEVEGIKDLYEKELSESRQLLAEKSKDIAKLELDLNSTIQEIQDLTNRSIKRMKELASAEKKASYYESRANELQGKLSQALSKNKHMKDVNKELKADLDAFTAQLTTATAQLEAETLMRIDFENRLLSSKEEMIFKSQVYDSELAAFKARKQVKMKELDEQLQKQFDQKLVENIHELREQHEHQMRVNEMAIETLCAEKISDLKLINEQLARDAEMARDELLQTKTRSSTIQTKIYELEVHNGALSARAKKLEKLIDDQQKDNLNCIMRKEGEIRELQEKISQQLKDNQDLTDIKIALDMEIADYRKLLEGEEERYKITPPLKSASRESRSASSTRFTPVSRPSTPTRGEQRQRDYLNKLNKRSTTPSRSTANARRIRPAYRQVLSASTSGVSLGTASAGEDGREELYFHQGDPIGRREDACAIM